MKCGDWRIAISMYLRPTAELTAAPLAARDGDVVDAVDLVLLERTTPGVVPKVA